ncbi:hypothetical protein AMS68_005217 [Peltaster fructicola]|uniref:Pre-mRNA polyadenylation factor Fip1 domain-containing protein n=1 Tax=Peltaster fructicola TaxID=286661 RepID=A0A6H0XZ60_9PEZI|nr:hypothetical protein AMS68_005217 [Peltaster fructicola]
MDDDEDDFYGGSADRNGDDDHEMTGQDQPVKAEAIDVSEEEEEDSDDDVQFTMEKPESAKTEAAPTTRATSKAVKVEPSTTPQPKTARQSTAPKQSTSEQPATKSELLHDGKEGKDFPEYRTSNVDVEEEALWPANGKKITDLDIDADLAEHSKPWRLPGTDVTDFFNYGFDEYTWTQYCAKQQSMSNNISELKDQDTMMKSMLNMGEGMPDMNQMMQMMMGGMGGDPSKMDFSQMMSMGMPGMPPAGQQPNAGFNNAQAGFNGQQGSGSPLPQAGQGFQAPLGPSALQNTSGMNMDGFSPSRWRSCSKRRSKDISKVVVEVEDDVAGATIELRRHTQRIAASPAISTTWPCETTLLSDLLSQLRGMASCDRSLDCFTARC